MSKIIWLGLHVGCTQDYLVYCTQLTMQSMHLCQLKLGMEKNNLN